MDSQEGQLEKWGLFMWRQLFWMKSISFSKIIVGPAEKTTCQAIQKKRGECQTMGSGGGGGGKRVGKWPWRSRESHHKLWLVGGKSKTLLSQCQNLFFKSFYQKITSNFWKTQLSGFIKFLDKQIQRGAPKRSRNVSCEFNLFWNSQKPIRVKQPAHYLKLSELARLKIQCE